MGAWASVASSTAGHDHGSRHGGPPRPATPKDPRTLRERCPVVLAGVTAATGMLKSSALAVYGSAIPGRSGNRSAGSHASDPDGAGEDHGAPAPRSPGRGEPVAAGGRQGDAPVILFRPRPPSPVTSSTETSCPPRCPSMPPTISECPSSGSPANARRGRLPARTWPAGGALPARQYAAGHGCVALPLIFGHLAGAVTRPQAPFEPLVDQTVSHFGITS